MGPEGCQFPYQITCMMQHNNKETVSIGWVKIVYILTQTDAFIKIGKVGIDVVGLIDY